MFTIHVERTVDYKGEKYGDIIKHKIVEHRDGAEPTDRKPVCIAENSYWAIRICEALNLADQPTYGTTSSKPKKPYKIPTLTELAPDHPTVQELLNATKQPQ